MYLRGAGAAILCFDTTDRTSFAELEQQVARLEHCEKDCIVIVAGTKCMLVVVCLRVVVGWCVCG